MSDSDVPPDTATMAAPRDAASPPEMTSSSPSETTSSPPESTSTRGDSAHVANSPTSSDAQVAERAPLWLRRTDQVVVGTLLVALVVMLTIHWLRLSRWGTVSIELTSQEPREYFYSLDINSASWVEWAQLDGIGEKLARRIVADREERGPFRDANDVRRVRGIHARQLESMKPFLRGGTAIEVARP